MNIIIGALLLGSPVRLNVVIGAIIGLVGIPLVFLPELSSFSLQDQALSACCEPWGDAFRVDRGRRHLRTSKRGCQYTGKRVGMGYGAILMFTIALIAGTRFRFETTPAYVASLFYLALFGSVIALARI